MDIRISIPFYLNGDANNGQYIRVFQHYARLGLKIHLCGSEGELSKRYCKSVLSRKVKYIEVPQDTFCTSSKGDDALRKKFNDSLLTHGKDADMYCLVGADDIVAPIVFTMLKHYDPKAINMLGVGATNPLFITDYHTNERYRVQLNYRVPTKLLPGINAFTRAAMIYSEWQPYNQPGCETGAEFFFDQVNGVHALPGWVLMLKNKYALNQSDTIKARHTIYDLLPAEKRLVKSHE
jgi:hypothetical protein